MLLLQFISGVYINFAALPEWLQNVASVFPLKWLAQGFRSVFLPRASPPPNRRARGTTRSSCS